jgi:hypothetical protein
MIAWTDRRCRHCGCMDHRACLTPDGPCAWVAQDVCSHPDCVRAANATLWPHRGWLAGLADRLVNGPARARTWTVVALDGQAFALAAADVCDDADSWTGPDYPDDSLVVLRRGLTMDRAWRVAACLRHRARERPSALFDSWIRS